MTRRYWTPYTLEGWPDKTDTQPWDARKRDMPDLSANIERLLPGLTDDQKATVADLVVGTCKGCHEDDTDCMCWRDD